MNDVVERGPGFRELERALARIRRQEVVAGVLGEDADEVTDDGEATLIKVASVNEFGSDDGRIPERSYIRSTAEDNAEEWERMQTNVLKAVAEGKPETHIDKLLEGVGVRMQSQIQERIVELDDPPNAPSTIKAKGSSSPLIDTGQLKSSISHEVREI